MFYDGVITFFLPEYLRNNSTHPKYNELYVIVRGCLTTIFALFILYTLLLYYEVPVPELLYHAAMFVILLPCVRWNLYEKVINLFGILTYYIYFPVFIRTGGIYSVNIAFLYVYLLGALWGNFKYGIYFVCANIILLFFIYTRTADQPLLGSRMYALLIHSFSTIFISTLFYLIQKKKDTMNIETKELLNNQVDFLDREVAKRTSELTEMRQTLASDFHDETGNLLSAITRQATLLKLQADKNSSHIIENILESSNQLYSSSKHLLWNLNNDSENPQVLFQYLTSFGQSFYNSFDISFSAENWLGENIHLNRFEPFAAINLTFIFKEAMNNVVKHAGAREVVISMSTSGNDLIFTLRDDGKWKEPDSGSSHYGMKNIEKRCKKNNFRCEIQHDMTGTQIEIAIPEMLHSLHNPLLRIVGRKAVTNDN